MINDQQIRQRIESLQKIKRCFKVGYRTQDDAINMMKFLKQDNRYTQHHKKKPTSYYYCEDCSQWHLTSQPKEQQRNLRRHFNKLK